MSCQWREAQKTRTQVLSSLQRTVYISRLFNQGQNLDYWFPTREIPQGSVLGTSAKSPTDKQQQYQLSKPPSIKNLSTGRKKKHSKRTSASIHFAAEYQGADTTEGLLFSQTVSCVHCGLHFFFTSNIFFLPSLLHFLMYLCCFCGVNWPYQGCTINCILNVIISASLN